MAQAAIANAARLGVALAIFSGATLAANGKAPAAADADRRLVRNGVVVEFSATPVDKPAATLVEGGVADVRFRITDEATGRPLKGAVPGAWMDMAQVIQGRDGSEQKACKDKIALYLKGVVGIRPMLDLNSYFVVLLNGDASISVVDPVVSMAGVTSSYATTALKRPGADWVKHDDRRRLFVSMPSAGEVAVIETDTFKVSANVPAGKEPTRIVMQPDRRFLWVGNNAADPKDSGVTVIDADSLEPAGFIATGAGHHEVAFSPDSRHAFVTSRDAGTVTVVDVARRAAVKTLATGSMPLSAAYSALSRALYVSDGKDGTVAVIDGETLAVTRHVKAKPGLGPIRITPDGRYALAVNTSENVVHVVDTASNALVQDVPVQAQPFQIAFTGTFAYVRSLGSERVSMINLATLGKGRSATVQSFAAGTNAPKRAGTLSIADGMAAAATEGSVFVVDPVDGSTFYYMEGMNATSSNYRVFGSNPRAVTVVDRSLKEVEPGVYAGRVKLPAPGKYDVAFMMQSPQLLHCFSAQAAPNPLAARDRDETTVDFAGWPRKVNAGEPLALRFRLFNPATGQPRTGIKDVEAMYFAAPGRHRTQAAAREIGDGLYEVEVNPAAPGAYYLHVAVPSMKLGFVKLPYFSFQAAAR